MNDLMKSERPWIRNFGVNLKESRETNRRKQETVENG
jgi:hypothetical protein